MDPITTKDIDQIERLVKLVPKYLLAMLFTLIVILVVPEKLLFIPGVFEFRENYKQFLGPALVLVTFLLVFEGIKPHWQRYQRLAPLERYLCNLTDDEKQILKRYIGGKTRTQDLKDGDGNVMALVHNRVLLKGSSVLLKAGLRVCNIQNWAWDYLNKNKQLLDITEGVENL